MKKLLFIFSFLLAALTAGAQQNDKSRFEKIRSLKVAFITEKINLTPAQSAKFWPVYNAYQDELRAVRRSYKQQYKDAGELDEHAAAKKVDDDIQYQQQELSLKKKYKDELLKVISPQQLAQLYDAERDFKKMLVEQLKER